MTMAGMGAQARRGLGPARSMQGGRGKLDVSARAQEGAISRAPMGKELRNSTNALQVLFATMTGFTVLSGLDRRGYSHPSGR